MKESQAQISKSIEVWRLVINFFVDYITMNHRTTNRPVRWTINGNLCWHQELRIKLNSKYLHTLSTLQFKVT